MATLLYDDRRDLPDNRRTRITRRGLIIRFVVVLLLLGLVGGGLYGFEKFREKMIADFFAHNTPPPTPVAAAPAESGDVPQSLSAIGTAVAIRQVLVSAEVQGQVTQIFFEAGSFVQKGQPIVQLNDAPERADLANYQAQAKLGQANLDRSKTLANRDFATQASVDANQAELDEAKAGIAKTQALIDQKLIKAPFAGQLGIRKVELGKYVGPGDTLVSLTDLDTLYVDFTLPEQDRAKLVIGRPVEIRVDAFPGKVFRADLTTIEPQVDPGTRTIMVQATLANPDHSLPGMFAKAQVVLPALANTVSVPATAIDHTLYGDSVFVLRPTGKDAAGKPTYEAQQTYVTTGEAFGDRVAIVKGLEPGQLVAISGQLKLHPGAAATLAQDDTLALPAQIPVE